MRACGCVASVEKLMLKWENGTVRKVLELLWQKDEMAKSIVCKVVGSECD